MSATAYVDIIADTVDFHIPPFTALYPEEEYHNYLREEGLDEQRYPLARASEIVGGLSAFLQFNSLKRAREDDSDNQQGPNGNDADDELGASESDYESDCSDKENIRPPPLKRRCLSPVSDYEEEAPSSGRTSRTSVSSRSIQTPRDSPTNFKATLRALMPVRRASIFLLVKGSLLAGFRSSFLATTLRPTATSRPKLTSTSTSTIRPRPP